MKISEVMTSDVQTVNADQTTMAMVMMLTRLLRSASRAIGMPRAV